MKSSYINKSFRFGAAFAIAAAAMSGTLASAQGRPSDEGTPPGTDFVANRQIPAGTPIKVILVNPVSSDNSQSGDLVKVRVAPDDNSGVPKSILFLGHVRHAVPATAKQPGEVSLRFDALSAAGHWEPAGPGNAQQGGPIEEASAKFVGGNSASGSSKDIGVGAAAGAVIGGSRKRKLGDAIEGGVLGALVGLGVQKATTHAASDIELKSGQEVTITLQHPIIIRTELIAS